MLLSFTLRRVKPGLVTKTKEIDHGAMLTFDRADPFPLVATGEYSETEHENHAELVDEFLHLPVTRVERSLNLFGCRQKPRERSGLEQNLWLGLAPQRLLTPYTHLREVLTRLALRPGDTIADLGAGYGRMAFVLARHFLGVKFVGYEYCGERVFAASLALSKFVSEQGAANRRRSRDGRGETHGGLRMEHVDLAAKSFSLIAADIYFVYDYGAVEAINKTLFDLRKIAQARAIRLVVRGRAAHALLERYHRDWLAPQTVGGEFRFYSSCLTGEMKNAESANGDRVLV